MLDSQKLVGSGPVQPVRWLRLCPQRISYKICLLMFKCLKGLAPAYLTDLCWHCGCFRVVLVSDPQFEANLLCPDTS